VIATALNDFIDNTLGLCHAGHDAGNLEVSALFRLCR
jgi:hypothetical protein